MVAASGGGVIRIELTLRLVGTGDNPVHVHIATGTPTKSATPHVTDREVAATRRRGAAPGLVDEGPMRDASTGAGRHRVGRAKGRGVRRRGSVTGAIVAQKGEVPNGMSCEGEAIAAEKAPEGDLKPLPVAVAGEE